MDFSSPQSAKSYFIRAYLLGLFFVLFGICSQVHGQTNINSGSSVSETMLQGSSFNKSYQGSGAIDNSYKVLGSLPPGMSGSTANSPPPSTNNHVFVLSGTPTTAGSYTFQVEVSANSGSVPLVYNTLFAITVSAAPPTANSFNQTVQQNSAANIISASTTGSVTSLTIVANPLHGSLSISGLNLIYTPITDYFGSDEFNYKAMGPGGESGVAKVTLNVQATTPAITNTNITVNENSSANSINPSITGTATSLSITTPPSKGSAIVSGLTILYTPNANYFGSDQLSFTATGPGGTSSPATASITILALAPSLNSVALKVTENSSANSINPSITGTATSLSITTPPTKGSAIVSGLTILYTPNANYFGSDQLSFTATGPGGTSSPTTANITVLALAPSLSSVTLNVTENSSANSINPSITGTATSLSITTPPTKGSAIVSGLTILYTPNANYFGSDQLSFTATGPGGTSSPATASINVLARLPLITSSTVNVLANSQANIITPTVSGQATSLTITKAPTQGSISLNGLSLSYTPKLTYVGTDSVDVSVTGPGGTSSSVTISINVTPLLSTTQQMQVDANSSNNPILISNANGATGLLLSVAPSHGSVNLNGLNLSYTPAINYVGTDTLSYSVLGSNGSFASSTVNIVVSAPAAKAKDLSLQVESKQTASIDLASAISGSQLAGLKIQIITNPQFGRASLNGSVLSYTPNDNYIGKDSLQFLANAFGGNSNVATLSITVTPRPDQSQNISVIRNSNAVTAAVRQFELTQIENFNQRLFEIATQKRNAEDTAKSKPDSACSSTSMWIGGLTNSGTYRGPNGFQYTNTGFSMGADRCFSSPQTVMGFGLGHSRIHAVLDNKGSYMTANANTAASYLSHSLLPNLRFSMMLGANHISDRYDRFLEADLTLAHGQWSATQLLSTSSVSSDFKLGGIVFAPYVRIDFSKLVLDPYVETGSSAYLLHYFEQNMKSRRSTLGLNTERKFETPYGDFTPKLRVEIQRDHAIRDSLKINYADAPNDAVYLIPANETDRRIFLLFFTGEMVWKNGLVTILNVVRSNSNLNHQANRIYLRFSFSY